jgi:ketosteroid isomerase-like protein
MGIELPRIIKKYVAASNKHEVKSILACFSNDAIVRDEQEILHGKQAMRVGRFGERRGGCDENGGRTYLAELSYSGDDATHNAAHHATDWIPTAHSQATERATGHTQQDVTDRMF